MKYHAYNAKQWEVPLLLSGQRTQFRKVIKKQPNEAFKFFSITGDFVEFREFEDIEKPQWRECIPLPYEIGQRLWVRETWVELLHTSPATDEPLVCEGDKLIEHATFWIDNKGKKRWRYDGKVIAYRATSEIEFCDGDGFGGEFADRDDIPRWRSPVTMPRRASRLTLEVTDVRVQRLQDISEEDAKAEGIDINDWYDGVPPYRHAFMQLWSKINGTDSWDANPWVFAVTHKRVEG